MTVIGAAGLGVVLLSFANSENPPLKRYEVIRSVNGQVTTCDTLIDPNSTFTPQDYLNLLGFSQDDHVEIIHLENLPGIGSVLPCNGAIQHADSIVIMDFHGNPADLDSLLEMEISVTQNFEGADFAEGDQTVMIMQLDSMNEQLIEIQRMVEIMLTDSMLSLPEPGNADTTITFLRTTVICNGEGPVDGGVQILNKPDGNPTFEHHVDNGNQKMDFMVFGDEGDFTLLIVSDELTAPTKSQVKIENAVVSDSNFKLYPNPAEKEVNVQLYFEEKANTNLTVSDSRGKVVMQFSLGDFGGAYNQTIDVSKWSKGIYFVNIDRPGMKLVEKLVVE